MRPRQSSLQCYDSQRTIKTVNERRVLLMSYRSCQEVPVHKQLSKQEACSFASDSIWLIESGFLQSRAWDEAGTVIPLGFWGPGEQISTAFSTIFPLELTCLRPARLRFVSDAEHCSHDFLRQQLRRTEEFLCIVSLHDIQTRLLNMLLWLAERFGQPIDEDEARQLLPLRLTHGELAELIGSSRGTITRCMNRLQTEGLLELHKQSILLSRCSEPPNVIQRRRGHSTSRHAAD